MLPRISEDTKKIYNRRIIRIKELSFQMHGRIKTIVSAFSSVLIFHILGFIKKRSKTLFNYLFEFFEVILLTLINFYLFNYITDRVDLSELSIIVIYLFVLIPSLLYLINVLQNINKKRQNHIIDNYKLGSNNFTSLINLLIYFTTLVIFLALFTDKPPALLIPNLKPGTFGLRAWSDSVEVKDLQVFYADSNKHWQKIPGEILFNKCNWRYPEMVNEKKDTSKFKIGVTFIPDSGIIRLSKCAAVFYPNPKIYTRVFHNVRIRGKIKFIGVDKPGQYPGFQFVTLIDTQLNHVSKKGYKDSTFFSEVSLQFNLDFNDYPIPFIPDLDWMPSIISKSSKKELKKNGSFEYPLTTKKYYDVSAIIYDNQVLFLGHKYGSCTLFEAKIDNPKNN